MDNDQGTAAAQPTLRDMFGFAFGQQLAAKLDFTRWEHLDALRALVDVCDRSIISDVSGFKLKLVETSRARNDATMGREVDPGSIAIMVDDVEMNPNVTDEALGYIQWRTDVDIKRNLHEVSPAERIMWCLLDMHFTPAKLAMLLNLFTAPGSKQRHLVVDATSGAMLHNTVLMMQNNLREIERQARVRAE